MSEDVPKSYLSWKCVTDRCHQTTMAPNVLVALTNLQKICKHCKIGEPLVCWPFLHSTAEGGRIDPTKLDPPASSDPYWD